MEATSMWEVSNARAMDMIKDMNMGIPTSTDMITDTVVMLTAIVIITTMKSMGTTTTAMRAIAMKV